ncbi:hypothetical protein SDC9_53983 [bioreactor metagenome]|uniref:Uncharacterized protein n=1 Tax=bioreactor metagenome TaxID=1076179 RepID=A0A644WUT6_9ZZZZ
MIHRPFDAEGTARVPKAPERGGIRMIGIDAQGVAPDVVDPVRAGTVHNERGGQFRADVGIGARINEIG